MEVLIFNRSTQWRMFLWFLLFWTAFNHSMKCGTCSTNRSIFCIPLFPSMEKRISLKRTYIWDTAPSSMSYLLTSPPGIWLEPRRSHHTYRHDVCSSRELLSKNRKNTCLILLLPFYSIYLHNSSHWSH